MKVGGQIIWNVSSICETSQIYYLMARRLMKDGLGNHYKDRLFHLVHWLSITFYCEGPVKNPSIWKESLTWIVPRIRSVRGWNLEGRRTDRRPEVGDDGRIGNLLKKTQCERGDITQRKRRNLLFQSQMEENKTLGGDLDLRTSSLVLHRPIRGESNIDFLGEPDGSLAQPQSKIHSVNIFKIFQIQN